MHQILRSNKRGVRASARREAPLLVNRPAGRFILRTDSVGSRGWRYSAIHPEIPQRGVEGLRPGLPQRQRHTAPVRTRGMVRPGGSHDAASKPAPSPAARVRHLENLTHVSEVWKGRPPASLNSRSCSKTKKLIGFYVNYLGGMIRLCQLPSSITSNEKYDAGETG
jgi:hypothetical protein